MDPQGGDAELAEDCAVQLRCGGGGGRGDQGPDRDDHEEDGRRQGWESLLRGFSDLCQEQSIDVGGIWPLSSNWKGNLGKYWHLPSVVTGFWTHVQACAPIPIHLKTLCSLAI